MSFLKDEGLSDEQIKNLVRKGIIPCSVNTHDEIITFYRNQINSGIKKSEAVHRTSEEYDESVQWINSLIRRYL